MSSVRKLLSATAALVAGLVSFAQAWALDPLITRTTNHGSYTAVGTATLDGKILRAIGGVHSQTYALIGSGGAPAPVRLALAKDGEDYAGALTVSVPDGTGLYQISYDDLVPMALFLDGGGTSLYTAWDRPERQGPDFRETAGFTKHERRGLVAIEFARSRFAESLYYADFCRVCLGRERPDVVRKLGGVTPEEAMKRQRDIVDDSYINSDLGLVFGILVRDGAVVVDGNIVRLSWLLESGAEQGLVWQAQTFKHSRDIADEIAGRESEFLGDTGVYRTRTAGHALVLHRDAQFLYASLALLRTFKETASAKDWEAFMADVRALSATHPEPWQAYTTSYCEVFADRDCPN